LKSRSSARRHSSRPRIAARSAPASPFLVPSAAIDARTSSRVIVKRSVGLFSAVAFMNGAIAQVKPIVKEKKLLHVKECILAPDRVCKAC
jgi:hypothetical protein